MCSVEKVRIGEDAGKNVGLTPVGRLYTEKKQAVHVMVQTLGIVRDESTNTLTGVKPDNQVGPWHLLAKKASKKHSGWSRL